MKGRKTGTSRAVGCSPLPFGPGEDRQIGRVDAVPDLLQRIDVELERLRQRDLGEPGRDADAQRPGGELEQGEAAAGIEMVEHPRQRRRRLRLAQASPAARPRAESRSVPSSRSQASSGFGQSSDTVSAMSPT